MDISVKSVVLVGNITQQIIKNVWKENIDLIVMGSRWLGGFKKFLLGSVFSGPIQNTKCSVLIVK